MKTKNKHFTIIFPLLVLIMMGCGTKGLSLTKEGPLIDGSKSKISVSSHEVKTITQEIQPFPVQDPHFSLEESVLYLEWEYYLPGDFNRDLNVDGKDVFPLAAHFGNTSSYGGGERTEIQDDCIDGNMDGFLDGKDLFVVSVNFSLGIDSLEAYHRIGDLNFSTEDLIGTYDPNEDSPPDFPLCAREYSVEIGSPGEVVNLGMVRAICNSLEKDSPVAAWPDFSGTMIVEGEPNGEIPCFITFSVELTGGTPPFTYAWEFGDGFETGLESPMHDYVSVGPFEPSVTVSDAIGLKLNITSPTVIEPRKRSEILQIAAASTDGYIYMMDSDGRNHEPICELPLGDTDRMLLSEDQSTIVAQKGSDLWVVNTQSGEMENIVSDMNISLDFVPEISGNGEWILFENADEPALSNSYVVKSDGSELTKILSDVPQRSPALSGDGNIFATEIIWESEQPADPLEGVYYLTSWPEWNVYERFRSSDFYFNTVASSYDGSVAIGSMVYEWPRNRYPILARLKLNEESIVPIVPESEQLIWSNVSCDATASKIVFYNSGDINQNDIIKVLYVEYGLSCEKTIYQINTSYQLSMSLDGDIVMLLNRGSGLNDKVQLMMLSTDGLEVINVNDVTGISEFFVVAVPGNRRFTW